MSPPYIGKIVAKPNKIDIRPAKNLVIKIKYLFFIIYFQLHYFLVQPVLLLVS